jgi:hypothetical protein
VRLDVCSNAGAGAGASAGAHALRRKEGRSETPNGKFFTKNTPTSVCQTGRLHATQALLGRKSQTPKRWPRHGSYSYKFVLKVLIRPKQRPWTQGIKISTLFIARSVITVSVLAQVGYVQDTPDSYDDNRTLTVAKTTPFIDTRHLVL